MPLRSEGGITVLPKGIQRLCSSRREEFYSVRLDINSLQHQGIVHSINSAAKDTTREVSAVDKHLSEGIFAANRDTTREVSAADKHLAEAIYAAFKAVV